MENATSKITDMWSNSLGCMRIRFQKNPSVATNTACKNPIRVLSVDVVCKVSLGMGLLESRVSVRRSDINLISGRDRSK